jgi:hypothetical protein
MQMFTAKVVDGHLDVPEGALRNGSTVIVLVPEGDQVGFTLTDAEKAGLSEGIEQLRRGEGVDGWEFLRELKS